MPENLSDCDDTKVIIRALSHRPEVIDIKAAGTAMRYMTAYLSVTEGEHTIPGCASNLLHRIPSLGMMCWSWWNVEIFPA